MNLREIMKVCLVYMFISGITLASTAQQIGFDQGTALLRQKNYLQALEFFKKTEQSGLSGFGLYRNIGLCYAGLNEDAEAILYFEKAHKICPNDQNAAKDLAIVRKKNTALADLPQSFFIVKVINRFFGLFHADTWGYLSLILMGMAGILIVIRYPFTGITKKEYYFFSSLLFVISLAFIAGLTRNNQIYHNSGIIITSPDVHLKLGPDHASPDVMELPPGTKVYYQEFFGVWWHVRTDFGDEGWIESNSAKRI